ncbi:M56 family metallopeptidase [Paludisphaera rhizosphaerae]|uniref:M56 family metallopeptidase n=1 Tax=Paludisphaera rhizosphaerae TaxID=2711216 RepID=UPI0013EA2764|nr:M56 family metallopeptidase [Paludisphaera rhizosphaerae]
MTELEMLRAADSLILTVAWQATMFLALGLAASFALRRRPARAHQALMLAMFGAVAAPLLTEAGRRLGLGMWGEKSVTSVIAAATPAPSIPSHPERRPVPSTSPMPVASSPASSPSRPLNVESPPLSLPPRPFPWRSVLLAAWAAASAVMLVRLAASFASGRRLVRRAEVVVDGAVDEGLAAAAKGLGLGLHASPALARSADVRCPVIWCWGSRPLLLLPMVEAAGEGVDRVAVFRHELAHWRRRDHLSTLAAELLVVLLPWHLLAWAVRAQLGRLAELACDDWVLAGGTSASDYAATLLGLIPQPHSPALAAASGRSGLRHRIVRILSDNLPDPAAGPRWTAAACLAMLLAASLAALAQARPAAKPDEPPQAADPPKEEAPMKTVRGKVLDPDGKPVPGATVMWIGSRKPRLPYVAMPRGDRAAHPRVETIARGQTGADGGFTIDARYRDEDYEKFNGIHIQLVVRHPGTGMLSVALKPREETEGVTLNLPREQVVRGRLLTPGGMPAEGVRVMLQGFHNDNNPVDLRGAFVGNVEKDEDLPDYWPRSVHTDADGRFEMQGVPVGMYVNLEFRHPEFAVDEVTVNTIPERTLSPGIKGFEIEPVEPTFEHVLEPARPVEGRVTDHDTGAPLADVYVEVIPMRRHGGQTFSTRSDADGRYRVSGHTTDGTYFITAFPSARSGYLTLSERREGATAQGKSLKVDLALDKGRLVAGRVVDHDDKTPVAGAAVVYQPEPKNPNNKRDYDLRSPVSVDADGRFRITVLPGKGFLAVEAPKDEYIRTSRRSPMRSVDIHPHGLLEVDIPKEGDVPPVEIELRKGKTLEARVLDPDGRPVDVFTAMFKGIDAKLIDVWNQGRRFSDGLFRIPGADPEKTYRVYLISTARRLATVAELKLDPTGKPLEVRLQPTATVKGKVAGGVGNVQVYPMLLFSPVPKEYKRDELFDGSVASHYSNILGQEDFYFHRDQPQPDGTFAFEALIPGAGVEIAGGSGDREVTMLIWDLKPGEVRDIGTLTLKERER